MLLYIVLVCAIVYALGMFRILYIRSHEGRWKGIGCCIWLREVFGYCIVSYHTTLCVKLILLISSILDWMSATGESFCRSFHSCHMGFGWKIVWEAVQLICFTNVFFFIMTSLSRNITKVSLLKILKHCTIPCFLILSSRMQIFRDLIRNGNIDSINMCNYYGTLRLGSLIAYMDWVI